MIKTLWRKFEGWLDPYYELSADQVERLLVAQRHYWNALQTLQRARSGLDIEIHYLELELKRIEAALQGIPQDEMPF